MRHMSGLVAYMVFSRPFVLFYWWDRARTAPVQGPIFTTNTPYDVIPRKEVP